MRGVFLPFLLILLFSTVLLADQPVVPFLIIYHGSQGSSWFVEVLSEFRDICIVGNELIDRVKGEVARKYFVQNAAQPSSWSFRLWRATLLGLPLADEPASRLDQLYLSKCTGSEKAFGYKARFTEQEFDWVLDLQEKFGIKIIYLTRNPIKQSVSAYRRDFDKIDERRVNTLQKQLTYPDISEAEREKITKEIAATKAFKTTFEKPKLKKLIKEHLNYYNWTMNQMSRVKDKRDILILSYEEMQRGMEHVLNHTVLPFIGITSASDRVIDPKKSKPSDKYFVVKATQDKLCDALQNFDELCGMIRNGSADPSLNPNYVAQQQLLDYVNVDACSLNVSNSDSMTESHRHHRSLRRRLEFSNCCPPCV